MTTVKNQRSSSICLSGSQTFDAMKSSVGGNNRESSSGSDSPEVRREVITNMSSGRPAKARQNARRSKSERLQGANKPRVKRRDLALDLDRANSGSLAGGLGSNSSKEQEDAYQSFLRKVPSVGAGLMNDSFNDTPDGSPRLRSIRQTGISTSKPPLGASSNAVPAISTPDLSPSLIRRATVNSAGVRTGSGGSGGGSRSQLANRNSPQVGRASKDQPLNKRATSVRVHGASSSVSTLYGPVVTSQSFRRSTFLDVPDSPGNGDDDIAGASSNVDEDSYRLRSFDLTRKGDLSI